MKIRGIGDLLNRNDRDDDDVDEFDEVDEAEEAQPRSRQKKRSSKGVKPLGTPKRISGDDFMLPNVSAVLNDEDEPEVTAEQCRNVKFNVSKPEGYYFPQVEAYAESVTKSLSWYDEKLLEAKHALFDLVQEYDLQVEQVQELRIQIEAFKVQGQAVVNPDGSYYMESQQKMEEELQKYRESYEDNVREQGALKNQIAEMQTYITSLEEGNLNSDNDARVAELEAHQNELLQTITQWEQRDNEQEDYIAELEKRNAELSLNVEDLTAKVTDWENKAIEWENYATALEENLDNNEQVDTVAAAVEDEAAYEQTHDIVDDEGDILVADNVTEDDPNENVDYVEDVEIVDDNTDVDDVVTVEDGNYSNAAEDDYVEPVDDSEQDERFEDIIDETNTEPVIVNNETENVEPIEGSSYIDDTNIAVNDYDSDVTADDLNNVDVQPDDEEDSDNYAEVETVSAEGIEPEVVDTVVKYDTGHVVEGNENIEEDEDEDTINFTYKNDVEGAPLTHKWDPDEEAQWAALFTRKNQDDE